MTAKILLLTILNSLFMVSGQVLWKTGMHNKTVNSVTDILQAMASPVILAGLFIYVVATFLWLYILSKAELSYAYPIQSLAYVFALVMALVIFKEAVTVNRWIGAVIICLGVYVISMK